MAGTVYEKHQVVDRTFYNEYLGKNIRMTNGHLNLRAPQWFDHFVGGGGAYNSAIPKYYTATETGTGTSHALAVSTTTGSTEVALVAGGTTNNAQEFGLTQVAFVPATMALQGPLVFEARVKVVGATNTYDGDFALGFANAVTFTNGLSYIAGSSSLLTTTAPVEFAGFYNSSLTLTGTLGATPSGNNGTLIGIVTEISSVAPVVKSTGVTKDNAYHIYRVEIDAAGNATFYVDDAYVGFTALAVTAATALTPYFDVISEASHACTMTIDYLLCAAGNLA